MLPKKKRLKKQDFTDIKLKTVFRGEYADIAISPHTKQKFSCVISKKRIKQAVLRNTVRRKVYSALQNINLKNQYLVVIYPKQSIIQAPYSQIYKELKTFFDTL